MTHPALRSPTLFALASGALALLSGCQVGPGAGSVTQAQVISLPALRSGLGGGHRDLHAAVRAGVQRDDVAAGRLVRGDCVEPDPEAYGGRVSFTVTTVLPAGTAWPVNSLVNVTTPAGVTPDAVGARPTRQHGRFVALAPEAAGSEPPRCHPPGAAPGTMRVAVAVRYQPWQFDFAQAEVRRHDQFSDADFASRSVVELGCRVEAMGDKNFMQQRWFARLPPGMALAAGDTVRLRAGAAEDSKDVAPLAEILGPAPRPAGLGPATRVRCG